MFHSTVTLNTGEIGTVIAVSPVLPTRPTVRVIYNQQGNRFEEEKIVDLSQDLTLSINAIDFDGSQSSKHKADRRFRKIISGGVLKIEANVVGDKGSLNLSGNLDTVEAFKSSVNCFEGIQCLEINFSGITCVDSTGIGGIIEAVKKSRERNIFVRYKNISQNIFKLFTILGVIDLCGKETFEWSPD